jgi:hypothetical protein
MSCFFGINRVSMRGCGKTIHEITRNVTKLFVLVRVISWIVLSNIQNMPRPLIRGLDRKTSRFRIDLRLIQQGWSEAIHIASNCLV